MTGKFIPRVGNILFGLFGLIIGSYLAVKSGLWGLEAIRDETGFGSVFASFVFSAAGLFGGGLSIIFIRFNKGAYFVAGKGNIMAKYNWDTQLSLDISEVSDVYVRGGSLIIKTAGNKAYSIPGLVNANEIYKYLKSLLRDSSPDGMDYDEKIVLNALLRAKRKLILSTTATLFFMLALFFNIIIIALLTGPDTEISDFNEKQTVAFVIFISAELITFIALFFFAARTGRRKSAYEELVRKASSSEALRHKDRISAYYGTVYEIFYYNENLNRIIIFKETETSGYSFMAEKFVWKKRLWKPCYARAIMYRTLEDVKIAVEDIFACEYFEK